MRIAALRAAAAAALSLAAFSTLRFAPDFYGPNPLTGESEDLGEQFRVFLFHVPAVWVGFACYFAAAGASVAYLARRRPADDRFARACAEVGLVLGTVNIVTGPIWAKPTWGTYWTWDPRLVTALVLWLVGVGYAVARPQVAEPERAARLGAAVAILGALNVPVVYFSVSLWGRVVHPEPGPGFVPDPWIRLALWANVAAFGVVAAYLVARRIEVLVLEARERAP